MHQVLNSVAEIRTPLSANRETRNVAYLAITRGRVPSTCSPFTGTPVLTFSPHFFGCEQTVIYRLYQPREGPVPMRTLLLL